MKDEKPDAVKDAGQVDQLVVLDIGARTDLPQLAIVKQPALLRITARMLDHVESPPDGESSHTYEVVTLDGQVFNLNFSLGSLLYPAQAWIAWLYEYRAKDAQSMFALFEGMLDRQGFRIVPKTAPGVATAGAAAGASVVCHWTADDVPACRLETRLQEFARANPEAVNRQWAEDFLAITVCAHTSHASAQAAIDALHRYMPGVDARIVNGQCPVYLRQQSRKQDSTPDTSHSGGGSNLWPNA